jgi:salicylate hydroxylase
VGGGRAAGLRVAVVGGGIAGLAAALALARRGARVTVHEQAPALREAGAGLQVTPNGGAVLAALGLAGQAATAGIAAAALEPMDGLTGARLARFDLGGLPGAGYRFFHRPDLLAMLAQAAVAAGVVVRTGARMSALPGGGLTGPEGEAIAADLTLGADGIHSVIRPLLNGAAAPVFSGQVAWRAVVAGEGPAVARLWMLPGAHVVTYPLPGGRINIVAVREEAGWAAEGWDHADDPANLCAAFAGAAAEVGAILGKVTEVRRWGLFRHPVAARWHGAGVALLGDAAHPTLPFLAQGANLALEDAWVLAAALDRWPMEEALGRYQAARRARVIRAIAAADANAVTYHLRGARRRAALAALGAIGRVAPGLFLRRYDWLYRHDVTRLVL